jgi:hypothetical protein
LNIFIAIIEEAYITTRMEDRSHWVFDYIKKDRQSSGQERRGHTGQSQSSVFRPKKLVYEKKASQSLKNLPEVYPGTQPKSMDRRMFHDVGSLDIRRDRDKPTTKTEERVSLSTREDKAISGRRIYDKSQYAYEKILDEEFASIEKNLEEIRLLSNKTLSTPSDPSIEELRPTVLEQINNIARRTQDIRSQLNKI